MSTPFSLDERLARDCHHLATLPLCELLLMNNALLPWFILVPRVEVVEIHEMTATQQQTLLDELNTVSRFMQQTFAPDKLNTAAIGNIVRQLHVHVVARKKDDICWPGVVWGVEQREAYEQSALDAITRHLRSFLPADSHLHQVASKH
ncbi:MAG: HIT family protein [Candidatus Thiodiazotropha sp.]|jgi:diadenosine tetraphosphate (Ap4A) HIT family hydrolase